MPKGKERNIFYIASVEADPLAKFSLRTKLIKENFSIQESNSLKELEIKAKEMLRIYLNFEKFGISKTVTQRKRDLKLLSSAAMKLSNLIDNRRKDRILDMVDKLLLMISRTENSNVPAIISIIHSNINQSPTKGPFFYHIKRSVMQLEVNLKVTLKEDLKVLKVKNIFNNELLKELELFSKCCNESIKYIKDKKYNYQLEELIRVLSKLWIAYTGMSPHTRYNSEPKRFKALKEDPGLYSADISVFYHWINSVFKDLEIFMDGNGLEKKITRGKMDGVLIEIRKLDVKK